MTEPDNEARGGNDSRVTLTTFIKENRETILARPNEAVRILDRCAVTADDRRLVVVGLLNNVIGRLERSESPGEQSGDRRDIELKLVNSEKLTRQEARRCIDLLTGRSRPDRHDEGPPQPIPDLLTVRITDGIILLAGIGLLVFAYTAAQGSVIQHILAVAMNAGPSVVVLWLLYFLGDGSPLRRGLIAIVFYLAILLFFFCLLR